MQTASCDIVSVMRRDLIVLAVFVLWSFWAAAPDLHGQQPVVAHVLDVKGEWRLQGITGLLAGGEGLIAGARITAGSNRAGDAITIVRDENMSRQRMICDGTATNPCRNPILVEGASAAAPSNQGQLKNMVQTAIAVLLSRPPAMGSHYALMLTRGSETVREWEDVAVLDPAQGLVLPPAPAEMPAGRYTVSIARAGEASSGTEQEAVLTSEGTWKPMPMKATGLYEVTIASADGERVADGMLLVVLVARYQALRPEFDEMKSRTATWSGTGARADEHLFLRAFLISECPAC